jgi:hypothetical protein
MSERKHGTPEWVMAMTDAEYKAYVEQGKFPERLKKLHSTKSDGEDNA